MIGKLFSPSGGLVYHWRAYRYRSLWHPFERSLTRWLSAWDPANEEILVIGASGGYTLSTDWLRTFKRITVVDKDPLAPFFFRRQHPGLPVHFSKSDVFCSTNLRTSSLSVDTLDRVLREHPRATVLFANILGQLLLERRLEELTWFEFLKQLREVLHDRNWASYHDLFSEADGNVRVDHLMQGNWSEGLLKDRFKWQLTPSRVHFVEGCHPPPIP